MKKNKIYILRFLLIIVIIHISLVLNASNSTIEIITRHSGVKVFLNNLYYGSTNYNNSSESNLIIQNIEPGEYTLKCVYINSDPYKETIVINSSKHLKFYPKFIIKYNVKIISNRGTKIYIDNKFIGYSPQELKLTKGNHAIKIKKEKYLTFKITKHINAAVTINESLRLAPPYAYIEIGIDEEIGVEDVYIDGVYMGSTPIKLTRIEAGIRTITIGDITKTYKIKDNHKYKIEPSNKLCLMPILKSYYEIDNHYQIPSKPKMLKEYRYKKYTDKENLTGYISVTLMCSGLGALIGAFGEDSDGKKMNNPGGGLLIGLLVGIGLDIIAFSNKDETYEKKIVENIEKNNENLIKWENLKTEIEHKNILLFTEENEKRKILNNIRKEKNTNRGFWDFKDIGIISNKEKAQFDDND